MQKLCERRITNTRRNIPHIPRNRSLNRSDADGNSLFVDPVWRRTSCSRFFVI
ncbi:MAG: hypothetical protein A4E57_03300 [Syntrophorhabdaceae bacterium PtaU1.Bin034]|nr:MAG: hypothetical protein A4E57_03300 [Syntrophorhabdaceae bacterium PtaU1.Bin034]